MQPFLRKYGFWAAALLMACAAALPLLVEPSLLNTRGGGDSPFLLQRLQQLETAVADGHFPVRWMPDANYGYGYPFYNYYAPLSVYITAVFRIIGFNYVSAIELSQLTGFLVAAAGMFVLGRRWFQSEWAGLLTAVVYTVAPFHMVNVYVRGDSLAEFWAMAFYPLLLLAVDGIFNQSSPPRQRWAIGFFAATYAALILSHNISALIFSPFLLLYILLRWLFTNRQQKNLTQRGKGAKGQSFQTKTSISLRLRVFFSKLTDNRLPITDNRLLITAYGFLLAFALAAWFFVPALAEKGLAQLGPVTEGYFHFSNHFLGTAVQPLLQTSFLFDYHVDGRQAFRMGLVSAVVTLAGAVVLLVTWRRGEGIRPYRRLFILLALLISTFMMLPWSRLLWERLPLLDFTQFPWRFLSVQAFVGALAAGGLTLLPWRKVVVPVTAGLLMLAALVNLPSDTLILTDADVTAERLAQYEWFTGNIGTTVSAEYLPYTVQPRMATSQWLNGGERWSVRALTGEWVTAQLQTAQTARQTWQVVTAVPSTLVFPTLHWPGWQAQVDGEPVAIRPSPGSGLIMLDVPAGSHAVELRLTRTSVRLAAEWLSLTAVLVLIWLLRPTQFPKPGKAYAFAGLALLLLVALAQWPESELSDDNLTWDFAQMAYLNHAPDGVLFSNGLRLQNYQYSQEQIAAGDVLTVTTNWDSAASAPTATLRLVSPAVNRIHDPSPPPFAADSQPIVNGRAIFTLTMPDNLPTGLFVPQLVLADGRPLTPSGQERGDLFLRPLPHLPETLATDDQMASLDVRAVQVAERGPGVLDVQLAWWTAVPLSHNYNVALRLTDAQGQFLQLADMQPGYGFQPSSLWPPGEWVADWLALPLPAEEQAPPYVLVAQLIDVAAPNVPVLTRRLGELWPQDGELVFQPHTPLLALPEQWALPEEMEGATAVFADTIQLHGYNVSQTTNTLDLTLVFGALSSNNPDYTRFVHLIPVGETQPVAQDDNLPRHGTYPTSQWVAGEVVEDEVVLNLEGMPPGEYQLAVGFYERLADGAILPATAVNINNLPLPDNRFLLPTIIVIGD